MKWWREVWPRFAAGLLAAWGSVILLLHLLFGHTWADAPGRAVPAMGGVLGGMIANLWRQRRQKRQEATQDTEPETR